MQYWNTAHTLTNRRRQLRPIRCQNVSMKAAIWATCGGCSFLFMEDVMTDFSDCRKGFYHLSKSWYASSVYHEYDEFADEIMIGMYADDGSTAGEFGIRWYEIDPQHGHVPRLEAYGVAWHVLAQLYDLLEVMADQNNEKITPDELRELLLSFGYNDLTKYEEPNRGNVTE